MNKIKLYFRIYWQTILLLTFGAFLIFTFLYILAVGIQAFRDTESFYRKMTLSGMGFQLCIALFNAIVFSLISSGFHYWLYMGGGLSKLGRKKVKPEKVNVKWADIIGMDSVKKDVFEVIRLIRDRTAVQKAGGRIIKGVLMMGPPGVGKTYLAKAIATETGLPFLSAVGSEFVGIFVGMGAARMKSLFQEARSMAELHGGCILFIDEIDVIAQPRRTDMGFSGQHDHNATVNQLLTEMDGLVQKQDNIVILAATNFHESELDPALMRAGRFDRKIHIALPGMKERKDLLKYYLGKIQYNQESTDIDKLARLLVGKSPADIANLVREASLIAIRKNKMKPDGTEFNEAHERISLGDRLEITLSEKDKQISAYHEAGKAIITYLLVPTQDVFKASIIPRKASGKGVTWLMEKEERFLLDKEELLGYIKINLAGFTAEKIRFGVTSTAVESDLKNVNELSDLMVLYLGMGTSGVLGISPQGQASEKDKEVLISRCLEEVNEILRKERPLLDEMAESLLTHSELDYDSMEFLFKKHGKTRLTYTVKTGQRDKKEGMIGWDQIIGMEETKEEAKEVVQLMRDRVILKKSGGNFIKGLLLFGPPGCGKTYLASAIANEAGVPLISRSGSEFVEMFVGVGASRIRNLFQEAREKALSENGCIIFIDEIDAVAAKRSEDLGFGGTSERNSTVNQLLVEMDGIKEKSNEYNIIVIGATNMDEQFLDPALLRPGRFDRKIYVDLPTWEDRKKLFAFYLKGHPCNTQEVDPEKFAGITAGWSPAEISNLIREASLLAARKKKEQFGIVEIEEARERFELGLKRKIQVSDDEKRATAIHETGHCMATYFFEPNNPPFKLSIVPRRKTLGVSWESRKGDQTGGDRNELLASIKVSLAGYAAEKLKCKATSAGVDSDFSNAINLANNMVWRWGMGKSGQIGNFHSLMKNNPHLISDETKQKLDRETQDILQECLKDVEDMLKRESVLMDRLVEELLKKEELNYRELEQIFKQ
ncbi:MAG: AAA family ATPase [Candidatus Aureabacteria bacterium]|nr:AAA family ATPase [Candidatus Auribacterota bacterium]